MAYLDAGRAAAHQVNFRWCEAHILALKAKVFSHNGDFEMALRAVKEAQAIATADGFSDMLEQQQFAAAEYAASLNDFATAFLEYKAGHACEHRLHVWAPLERSTDLQEEAGSHQSLKRLLRDRSDHGGID